MTRSPIGYMKRPSSRDMLAPQAVTSLFAAAAEALGEAAASELLRKAALFRLPEAQAPVPEDQTVRMYRALREGWPEAASAVARTAGHEAADALIEAQLSSRGQAMLSAAPWTVGAWLLGRWASQHSWTFAGSGAFRMVREMEFVIANNPFARDEAGAEAPVCAWQEALFERLFQRLVDPRLICREMTCAAMGAPECRFAFMLREGAEGGEP